MTAHDATPTPGPWAVIDKGKYFSVEWKPELKVCRTYGNSYGDAIDAHFIASAPALAEENARLRSALMFIKNLTPKPIGAGFVTGPQALLDAAQREARAALARKEDGE